MDPNDIIYICILVFSILFGLVYSKFDSVFLKQWVGSVFGISLIYAVSGLHIIHPIVVVFVNIFIIEYVGKRKCHTISFAFSFVYLLFFRLCYYFGIPQAPAHTNAVQMMITLKMVGVAFEIHDSWKSKEDIKQAKEDMDGAHAAEKATPNEDTSVNDGKTSLVKRRGGSRKGETKVVKSARDITREAIDKYEELQMRIKYDDVQPSSLDLVHYAFNYCGVLTGPYYKYKVYNDMIQSSPAHQKIVMWKFCLQRIKWLPLYAVLFLLCSHYFPLSFATTSTMIEEYSFGYRCLYMHPVFFSFKMRLYCGFILSECVCIMAGLGLYHVGSRPRPGKGPTDYKALQSYEEEGAEVVNSDYNFETVHNIQEYGTEASCTIREALRCWNMTVQYWLATNVYKRVDVPKPLKEALTMLTSAFWHGVHSGYYLSMLTVPFILMVEDYYAGLIRRRLGEWSQSVYDKVTWFFKTWWFAYMGMAFLLLQIDTTMAFWRSIGFLGHGTILILHTAAQFINLIRGKVKQKLSKCSTTAFGNDTRMRMKTGPECGEEEPPLKME